jgi:two-component system NarL family sensor kinase
VNDEEQLGGEGLGVALLRVALVPVAAIGESLLPHPELPVDIFPYVLAIVAVYAVAILVLELSHSERRPAPLLLAVVDLLAITALVYASGGARSHLRFAFFVLPVGAAVRLSPRFTAIWSVLAVVAYLAVALPHPSTDVLGDFEFILVQTLALAWVSAAAVMLSGLLQRRTDALARLARQRRSLVRQALDAEERERRRLAEALHDEAIQNVLAARQEVADVARGTPGAAERARSALDDAQRQLRQEVLAMHPLGLERAGIGTVLRSLADDASRRGGFVADVVIDPAAAGEHDALVLATARELLANAVKHSEADAVELRLERDDGTVRLEVSDDGRGVRPDRLEHAVTEGHIGLAALAERIEAVGGEMTLRGEDGHGTLVVVTLPDGR